MSIMNLQYARTRRRGIVRSSDPHTPDSFICGKALSVGSWGKFTRIRPPRDVDVVFKLPSSVFERFEQRSGNKQSQLLQEVKGHLQRSFTTTSIKGDGPVVLVPFTAFNVEVIPA